MRVACFLPCLTIALSTAAVVGQAPPATAEKQAVITTTHGELVLEVFPQAAPRHAAKFLERIESGFYVGTVFHRAVSYGIIQGGDPLSKDPARWADYGKGGLFELEPERNELSHVRGAVSAVLVPGKPNSAGSQFFICVTDQTQLDGSYTSFARVVEGMDVVEKISQLPADSEHRLRDRVEIAATRLRDRPPPEIVPFVDTPVEELAQHRVVLVTELGQIEIAFYPEVAPNHVRRFLLFSELGIYEGTKFHRIVPGFVIQGGSVAEREPPLPEKLRKYVTPLAAEFNERKHVRGTVSMARASDPDSALDSFFIVLEPNRHLDGKYTVFGYVQRGIDVVDGISQIPTRGETPIVPFRIESVRIRR